MRVFGLTTTWVLVISMQVSAQHKIKGFADLAVRFTGDAEMALIGPNLSFGGGISVHRWTFSSTYNFFFYNYRDGDYREGYRYHTLDLMIHYYLYDLFDPRKGFYFGAGLAWQNRHAFPETLEVNRPNYFTGAYAVGYRLPATIRKKSRTLAIDLKAFGPYHEESSSGSYTEAFTQLMIGLRLIY